jgi:protein-tyrosine phosphatase
MTKIRDKLFLSGFSSVNTPELDRNGITAILCCDHNLIPDLHNIREKYKWQCIHLHDHNWPNPEHMLRLAVSILTHLLQEGETVLVHCGAGANRSPTVVAAYLSYIEDAKFEDKWEELRKLRQQVQEHSFVIEYLVY